MRWNCFSIAFINKDFQFSREKKKKWINGWPRSRRRHVIYFFFCNSKNEPSMHSVWWRFWWKLKMSQSKSSSHFLISTWFFTFLGSRGRGGKTWKMYIALFSSEASKKISSAQINQSYTYVILYAST